MHRDPCAEGGGSGPRQRRAAGHEAWLLSGAWSFGLESACHIQGFVFLQEESYSLGMPGSVQTSIGN